MHSEASRTNGGPVAVANVSSEPEPIAIIGMACRLPGGIGSDIELWDFLRHARSGQCDVPADRFNVDAFYNPHRDLPDSIPMRGGYFIQEDVRRFENTFFGINNVEAANMDPQQRKLLEVCFECLENAGVGLQDVAGTNVGCYVASFTNDFQAIAHKDMAYAHRLIATGMGTTLLSNRISYALDLKGPSLTLDTACSSSLYCLHLAVRALRHRECDAALVGAANLVQATEQHMSTARLGVLSRTSTCHSFAADADGYGRADGVGALYLKRLSDALRDGDPIRSVIRGTAANSNGRGSAITVPSADGQRDVIARAYADAGLDPRFTDYVECHGTGTQVGDPIEVASVTDFFRPADLRDSYDLPILIGSVKSNLGHSEANSGITSIIKATLSLENQWIPPTIGVTELNPKIPWTENGAQVVRTGTPWPISARTSRPQRASINSFGYGGSNAHCVLERYVGPGAKRKPHPKHDTSDALVLLPLSAATEQSLFRRIEDMAEMDPLSFDMADLIHTLVKRRSQLVCRAFLITSKHTWRQAIRTRDHVPAILASSKLRQIPFTFIFTGQGAQWTAMGKILYQQVAVFRRRIDFLDGILAALARPPDRSIQDLLTNSRVPESIHLPQYSQPACTALQIALVDVLRDWGVLPRFVIGHSSGEIAAAYAAGHISAATAIIVAYGRGLVVTSLKCSGAMLAVGMSEDETKLAIRATGLSDKVRVACVNSPENVTVSGDEDGIDRLSSWIAAKQGFARKVRTGGKAYHSHHMQLVGPLYQAFLDASIRDKWAPASPTSTIMISSVRARVVKQSDVASAGYWRENLESPVLFQDAVEISQAKECTQIIEIGPHSALQLPIKQTLARKLMGEEPLPYRSTITRNRNGVQCLMELAGNLWSHGITIDLALVNRSLSKDRSSGTPRVLHHLPRYKWTYGDILWNESRISAEYRQRKFGHDELLGALVPGLSGSTFVWRNNLDLRDVPWLEDHRLGAEVVFPGAAYISMALKALQQIEEANIKNHYVEIRDLRMLKAFVLAQNVRTEIFTELKARALTSVEEHTSSWTFSISTFADGISTKRAVGSIDLLSMGARLPNTDRPPTFRGEAQGVPNWYGQFKKVGLHFGPTFQTLRTINNPRMRDCYASRSGVTSTCSNSEYHVHPPTFDVHTTAIDTLFQSGIVATAAGNIESLVAQIPTAIDSINARARPVAAGLNMVDAELVDEHNRVIVEMCNVAATAYAALVKEEVERRPMTHVAWLPDLRCITLAQSDALAAFLASDDLFSQMIDTADGTMLNRLLFLSGLLRCDTNVLFVSSKDRLADMRSILGGDTTHPLFNTLTWAHPKHAGSLEGVQVNHLPARATSWQHVSSVQLLKQKFDIIVIEDSSADVFAHPALFEYLASDGLIFFTGEVPPHSVPEQGSIVGVLNDVSVIQRKPPGISSVHPESRIKSTQPLILVRAQAETPFDIHLCQALAEWFGITPKTYSLHELESARLPRQCLVIVTAELEESFLASASEAQLRAVQIIAKQAARILWISGGSLYTCGNPEMAAVFGLSRSIMLEQPTVIFEVLGLESPVYDLDSAVQSVRNVLQKCSASNHDHEYLQHRELLYVSRVVPLSRLNSCFNRMKNGQKKQTQIQGAGFLRLDIDFPGQFDTLHFRQDMQDLSMGPEGVEVEIMAIGINAKNAYALAGKVKTRGDNYADDFSGIVRRIGSDVTNVKVGDRVIVFAPGSFTTTVVARQWACIPMRDDEGFAQVAAVPTVYMTAVHALIDRARLQPLESVLIHSATGGVGLAAIQVAQAIGATIFATVGTEEKRERLVREFGIPRTHIFNSRDTSFLPDVMRMTDNHGVDVVLNSLTGARLHAGMEACAMFGRFIEIGKKDIADVGNLNMSMFGRGLTFSAFDLSDYFFADTKASNMLCSRLLHQAIDMYRSHPIPSPLVFDAANVCEAFRTFANTRRMGRVCVSFEKRESSVQIKPRRHQYKFSSVKTYLLVGCLGGLGRSLARYMLENGARHFVFIGRTGTDKQTAKDLINDLRDHGASVDVVRGDVQDHHIVSQAVQSMTLPLGGVVQAAMGLGDALFETMTHAQWQSSLGPKVKGTWNIHRAIEGHDSALDFFLLTSSLAGSVGTATETNYCAANSFLDYFARYRRKLGRPAVSIGFGQISEIGYLHEHPQIEQMLQRRGLTAMTESDCLDVVDIALCHQDDAESSGPAVAHILTGLEMINKRSIWHQGYEGGAQDELADPRLSILVHAESDVRFGDLSGGSQDKDTWPAPVRAAIRQGDHDAVLHAILGCLASKISQLILMPVDRLDEGLLLSSVGMDSMLAAEYRSFIFHTLKVDVPFLTLMDPLTTLTDIASLVARTLLP